MYTTPAHGFMSVSVHYVDNVSNVKTNRGGIAGYILPIPLPSMQNYYMLHTNTCILLCNFLNFILYVYFIVHIVTVFLECK